MAPTEILSEQHWRKFTTGSRRWACDRPASRRVEQKAEKTAARGDFLGEMHIVIGTTRWCRKASSSRARARGGGRAAPLRRRPAAQAAPQGGRSLAAPADDERDPIPRTLSMTYYADLDVSVIDELPPGRRPVATRMYTAARRERGARAHPTTPVPKGSSATGSARSLKNRKTPTCRRARHFRKLKRELKSLRVACSTAGWRPPEKGCRHERLPGQ